MQTNIVRVPEGSDAGILISNPSRSYDKQS